MNRMKKSLFYSALLHLVLIAIFFSLPFSKNLLEKGKAIELTFGPPDATPQKTPSEAKNETLTATTSESKKSTQNDALSEAPSKPKSTLTNQPIEIPADVISPAEPLSTTQSINIEPTHSSTPTAPMQKSAYVQPESSPQIYGSMALDSYYYNKPMEAFPSLSTTQSPAKKPKQQYIAKPFMQTNPTIPMQQISKVQTEGIPTITLSIIIKRYTESTSIDLINTSTEKNPTTEQDYLQSIQQVIENYRIYPEEAKKHNNATGTVKVKFRINKDGRIDKMDIIESSSSEILDIAGIELLKKIERFQPIPSFIKKEFMDIILDINYKAS